MRKFKTSLVVALIATFGFALTMNAQDDMPVNAIAGKCYAKCLIPDQYETTTEQVLLKEASSRLEVVPAAYSTSNEQVLVKEGYNVLEIQPASFSTVTEEIMVKEAGERLDYVPPVYETVTEQVLVQPATTKWTKGRADRNCLSEDPDKCKVWCLTEIPAQYKTVTRQVLKSPATTRSTPIPAEFKTVTKAVVQSPAQVAERAVPAEYRTVTRQVLQSPASTQEVAIPAEYSTVSTQRLVRTGGFTDWVEVLCSAKSGGYSSASSYSTTTTSYRSGAVSVATLQQALKSRGFDPGPIDDIFGSRTRSALTSFQRANGLTPSGEMDSATLSALGL